MGSLSILPRSGSPAEQWMPAEFLPGLVSVVIPTYNRARFIVLALESVRAQGYRPIECIVVDDGSTDDTLRVISEWRPRTDHRFTLRYVNQSNKGGCAARNRGLRECSGQWINFLDSDDRLLPRALQHKIDALLTSSASYSYDRGQRIDKDGNTIGFFGLDWPEKGKALFVPYLFHTTGPMICRSACLAVGPWNESLGGWQEIEYFARLKLYAGKGVFVNEVGHIVVEHDGPRIVGSRKHQDSITRAQELILETVRKAGSDYAHEAEFLEGMIKLTYAGMAAKLSGTGNPGEAMRCLKKAYQFGYTKWHVRAVLKLHNCLPFPALVRSYFSVRSLGHRAKCLRLRLSKKNKAGAIPDEIGALFDKLNG
jgi:glycosyltransferase involved in cell wall biosynthesis